MARFNFLPFTGPATCSQKHRIQLYTEPFESNTHIWLCASDLCTVLPCELLPLHITIKIFAFIISAICRTCPIHFTLLNLIILIILKSPRHEGISKVDGCIAPCSSQLRASWSTHFTAGEKSPQYALGRELGGPHSQSGSDGKEENFCPAANQILSLVF